MLDKDRLLRELEIAREELAIQNEALRRAREAEEASRKQLSEIFERAPAGYADFDEKGRVLWINLTGAALLGLSRAQVEGLPFTAFVARENVADFLDHLRRGVKDGESAGARITLSVHRGADRSPVRVQLASVAWRRPEGRVLRTAFLEVPRRENEEEEDEAKRRAVLLAEFSPVALSLVDLPEVAAAAAALAARSLGACFVEVLELRLDERVLRTAAAAGRKRNVTALVHADEWPYSQVLRTREPVVLSGIPAELSTRAPHLAEAGVISGIAVLVPADPARPYGVMAAYSPVRRSWEPGEIRFLQSVAGTLGVAASRRRLEDTLKESEERFRSLVANSLAGFFIVQDGRIVFMNPEQERIFGALAVPCELEKVARLVHRDDAAAFDRLFRDDPASRLPQAAVFVRFVAGGHSAGASSAVTWTQCRAARVQYRNRDATLVNAVDITRTREMEQIAGSNDKLVSLGQLATGMAHEIRNPLSGLNLQISELERLLAERRTDRQEWEAAARRIAASLKASSERIESVIRRVMDFSRPRPPRFTPSDVNRCIESALDLSTMGLRRNGVRLRADLAANLPPVRADAQLIAQVLLNLLTNAGQAVARSDGTKEIEVASFEERGRVVVRVGDSGPGVPEAIRERIFSPFFTTKREGTGIGLAFSHRVIAEHGGSLTVGTSRLGGAEFRVELPVAQGGPASRDGTGR